MYWISAIDRVAVMLVALALVAAAVLYSKSWRFWTGPAPITAVFWAFLLIAPLLVWERPYYSWQGAATCAIFVACFLLGGVVVEQHFRTKTSYVGADVVLGSFPAAYRIGSYLLCFICGVVSVANNALSSGVDSSTLTSFASVGDIARANTVARYTGVSSVIPWPIQIAVSLYYSGAIIIGTQIASMGRHRGYMAASVYFLPAVAQTLLTTGRTAFLVPLVFTMAGVVSVQRGRIRAKVLVSRMASLFSIGLAAYALFTLVQMIRYSRPIDEFWDTAGYALNWAFGSPVAFSVWLAEYKQGEVGLAFGYWTFAGLFDQLGMRVRETGLYTLPVPVTADSASNVFTVFRGLISDFSILGSCLLSVAAGGVVTYASLRSRRGSIAACVPLVAYYAFLFWSPVVSIFIYNSCILAVVIFGVYIVIGSTALRYESTLRKRVRWQNLHSPRPNVQRR